MEEIITQIKSVQTTPQSVRVVDVKDRVALKQGVKEGVSSYYEGINGYWVTLKNETK